MGIPVLVLGESGSGKSTSLRNFKPDEYLLLNVAGKPLPFRGKPKYVINNPDYIDDIRINRKVLGDATTDILIVYLYKEATSNAYPAEKNRCGIQIDDFGGAGGESAKLNFTVNLQGDATHGTFDPSTKTFTEAGTE